MNLKHEQIEYEFSDEHSEKAIGKSIAKGIETDDLDSIFTLKMLTMIQKIDVSKLK